MASSRVSKRVLQSVETSGIRQFFQSRQLDEAVRRQQRSTAYLGLDVNTTSSGFAILRGDGSIIEWGTIDTTKEAKGDMLLVGDFVAESLKEVKHRTESAVSNDLNWKVGIEEFMKNYNFGRFHTKGLFMLSQLNGIVSYACMKSFGVRPIHCHPTLARSFLDLVVDKENGGSSAAESIKDVALAYAQSHHPSYEWKMNRKGTACTNSCYDIADAFVMARYTWFEVIIRDYMQREDYYNRFHDLYLDYSWKRLVKTKSEQEIEAYVRVVYENAVRHWIKANKRIILPTEGTKQGVCAQVIERDSVFV